MLYVNVISIFCTCCTFLSLRFLLSFVLVYGICCLCALSLLFVSVGEVLCNFSFYILKLIKHHDLGLKINMVTHKDLALYYYIFTAFVAILMYGNLAFDRGCI